MNRKQLFSPVPTSPVPTRVTSEWSLDPVPGKKNGADRRQLASARPASRAARPTTLLPVLPVHKMSLVATQPSGAAKQAEFTHSPLAGRVPTALSPTDLETVRTLVQRSRPLYSGCNSNLFKLTLLNTCFSNVMVKTMPSFRKEKAPGQEPAIIRGMLVVEESILKKVSHPNIVQLLGTVSIPSGRGLVLPCYPGSLYSMLNKGKPDLAVDLPLHTVITIADQLAGALHYLHQQHICHLDVKVDNILISDEMKPVLIDFGLADDEQGQHSILRDNYANPHGYGYAPEIAGKLYNPRWGVKIDIWGLGQVMYDMTCTHNLSQDKWRHNEAKKAVSNLPKLAGEKHINPWLITVNDSVTAPALLQLATQCLSVRRSRRPDTIKAVRERLPKVME